MEMYDSHQLSYIMFQGQGELLIFISFFFWSQITCEGGVRALYIFSDKTIGIHTDWSATLGFGQQLLHKLPAGSKAIKSAL